MRWAQTDAVYMYSTFLWKPLYMMLLCIKGVLVRLLRFSIQDRVYQEVAMQNFVL